MTPATIAELASVFKSHYASNKAIASYKREDALNAEHACAAIASLAIALESHLNLDRNSFLIECGIAN